MAITLVTAPTSSTTPQTDFASPVINWTAAMLNTHATRSIIKDGCIINGTVLCISGALYQADGDTAISGTESNYIAITASGSTATASYVSTLPTVTYDAAYGGYYDASGNLYLFDELNAISDGYISDRYFLLPPSGKKDLYTAGNIIIFAAKNLSSTAATGTLASLSVSKGGFVRISINYTKKSGNLTLRQNGYDVQTISTSATTIKTTWTADVACAIGDVFSIHSDALSILYMFTIGSGTE